VPCRIDFVNTANSHMSVWEVQRVWRDVVQQLQRRLRVSCRLDVIDASGCHVFSWNVQRVWRDVVYEL
jgi:hypothetical protein